MSFLCFLYFLKDVDRGQTFKIKYVSNAAQTLRFQKHSFWKPKIFKCPSCSQITNLSQISFVTEKCLSLCYKRISMWRTNLQKSSCSLFCNCSLSFLSVYKVPSKHGSFALKFRRKKTKKTKIFFSCLQHGSNRSTIYK